MKTYHELKALASRCAILLTGCLALTISGSAQAQNTLTNGLVAYWPMDVVTNGTTPDVSHGYDMNLINVKAANFIPSTRNGGFIGTQSSVSAGNCVSFTNSQNGFMYYLASPGDLLPINLQSNYTINFWINILGTNQSDLRIFAEDDFNGNSNPLWVVGTGGGGGSALDNNLHWLRRQQSITINGLTQGPDAVGTQNDSFTSLNPCDGTWHMFTITKQYATNTAGSNVENFEVYVDTVRDPGNPAEASFSTHLDAFGTNAVLLPEPVTNQNHPPTPWTWLINATSFGGLSRSITGGNFVTGQLDDAAMWNRTLSATELTNLYQNGLVNVASTVSASIPSFAFDNHEVLYGDKVTLRWTTAHATTLTISPTIGNVTAISVNGAGSTNLTITSNVTYTLVASRPGSSVTNTASVTVSKQPVAPNWHLIENFDTLATSLTNPAGIPAVNWDNVSGDFSGALDLFNVSSLTNTNAAVGIFNHVGGTSQDLFNSPRGAFSAYLLNGLTIQTNSTNTLFFRVYIQDTTVDNNDFSFFIGLDDIFLQPLAVSIYDTFGAGPRINIQRTLTGTSSLIDVKADDGVNGYDVVENGATNASSVQDFINNGNPNGLTPGTVYDFWIDIFDKPFGSSTNLDGSTNTSGTLYSVYYKPLGAPTRTLMFTNLLSDRFPFGTPATFGQLYMVLDANAYNANVVVVGTNTIVVDDIYLSQTNLNGTIPVAPGVFPDLIVPTSIGNIASVYLGKDPANGNNPSTTLTWSSIPGATYTVYKSSSLSSVAPWQLVTTELLSSGSTTSYKDTSLSASAAFYKVTSP